MHVAYIHTESEREGARERGGEGWGGREIWKEGGRGLRRVGGRRACQRERARERRERGIEGGRERVNEKERKKEKEKERERGRERGRSRIEATIDGNAERGALN